MDRKILVGRGANAVLGGLLIFVLALGALTGCGGSGGQGSNNAPNGSGNQGGGTAPSPMANGGGSTPNTTAQPPVQQTTTPEGTASGNVVVRVSGTQNTAYSGTYGTAQDVQVADGVVGTEPTDYDVSGAVDVVTATFKKTQPGGDRLEVSILNNGEVVTSSQTIAEFGSVTVNWSPQEDTQTGGATLPGGAGSDRSQP